MNQEQTLEHGGSKAIFYRSAPRFDGLKTASIGALSITDDASGTALLEDMSNMARNEGFEAILGPLNGNTWHSYRVVVESDGSMPFLLEPTSGPHDLTALQATGFEIVSRYMSARISTRAAIAEEAVTVEGIRIEPWDGQDAEVLIRHLFDMSTSSFDANNYFTPITFKDFLKIYQPMLPFIDPRHVLFARDDQDALQGFLFGTANMLNQTDKPEAILKTYASRQRGVGHLLADTYHRRAHKMGFETVIHALFHEDNTSRDRSAKHGAEIFRRYALMAKRL